MATDLDLLRDLCAAPAPTGFEAPVQEVVRRRLPRSPSPRATRWATSGARRAAGKGAPARRRHRPRRPDRPHRHLRRRARLRLVRQDRRRGPAAAARPQPHRARLRGPGERRGRPQAVAQDEQGRARQGARSCSDQWLDIGCSTRDEALELVQIGDPITFPPQFLELGQRPLRLAGLRQPRRRLRRACARSSTTPRRRRPPPDGARHGARGDHVHGRQGHGHPLAAGRHHRRRRGLRQRRPGHWTPRSSAARSSSAPAR